MDADLISASIRVYPRPHPFITGNLFGLVFKAEYNQQQIINSDQT